MDWADLIFILLAALLTIGLAAGGAACVPLVLILRGSKL